ncbi:MAG: glycine--tRNA ligase subunit beta [Candidatus Protistobacter heckmanni]|nr:glycine--tRNA ligase subunit beta [Candidatus Protistobacter heckmanni]
MTTTQSTLLVELLTEELPPKALACLGDAFAAGILAGIQKEGLAAKDAAFTAYATPRRLAVSIAGVRAKAEDKTVREKVLPVSVALDAEGKPAAPLTKKLAALGVPDLPLEKLERASDGKADAFFLTRSQGGAELAAGLQRALTETVAKLPIPKVMTYQLHPGTARQRDVQFVRPAHSLIALHGKDVVGVEVLGLQAGRATQGHRFLSAGAISIADAEGYAATLEQHGKVIASYAGRKERIRAELLKAAGSDQALMPKSLLDEVNSLVEWPVVYACHFEEAFLKVPQECLILTMQTNQKYFALTDAQGKLRNRFLIVSNLATATPEKIVEGNERVVRPRLADAKFFFEQDQKKKLEDRVPLLEKVIYHNKLGSQLARMERVRSLAKSISEAWKPGALAATAQRAATLTKADLLTDMVGEFPELQGIMGGYYARIDGEHAEVVAAMTEHYQPRFAGDALPATDTGTVLALADKLETLVGIWSIGLIPTGEKDPYALRRHALGILRILIEKKLPLALRALLEKAQHSFAGHRLEHTGTAAVYAILAFALDRLRGYLRDQGYSTQEVEAVVAPLGGPQNAAVTLSDIVERIEAVRAFAGLPEAQALAAANKRIGNILKKSETAPAASVNAGLFQEEAEKALHAALEKIRPAAEKEFAAGRFTDALHQLAGLREAVDSFFDKVMVNAEDPALRTNRIALLAGLHGLMNRAADLSLLAA